MAIHDAKSSRRKLADALDFVCFVTIALLYGAGAIVLAAFARLTTERAAMVLVTVLPLGVWVFATITLRQQLEQDDLPPEKRPRRQLREMMMRADYPPPGARMAPRVAMAAVHHYGRRS
jgi:hypothetical protein